jgi:hypothetical protein
MNNGTLTLTPNDGNESRRPREAIELTGEWSLAQAPESVEARLFWFTRGKGTQDVGIVETQSVELLQMNGRQRFRFKLPEAPYSFSGRLISIVWAVELVANDDQTARWEFMLAPAGGGEILLRSADATRAR